MDENWKIYLIYSGSGLQESGIHGMQT